MRKLWMPSRRSLIAGAAAAIIARPAEPGQKIALFSGGTPSWVLKGAKVDLNFATGQYFGGTLAGLLSISRASGGTDLLPTSASGAAYNTFGNNVLRITPGLGLLIEEARTNVLLNSAAPVTQTSASLATGTYTLWCNGAGTVTPSGGSGTVAGAAAASNGAPNTFVVTVAGTVVFTVSGALNAFQCELGAFGTSLIVTAGVTATRATDAVILTEPSSGIINQGTWFAAGLRSSNAGAFLLEGLGTTGVGLGLIGALTKARVTVRTGANRGDSGSGGFGPSFSANAPMKTGAAYSVAGALGACGGAPASMGAIGESDFSSGISVGSRNNSSAFWNNYISRIAYSYVAMTQAQLNALTT